MEAIIERLQECNTIKRSLKIFLDYDASYYDNFLLRAPPLDRQILFQKLEMVFVYSKVAPLIRLLNIFRQMTLKQYFYTRDELWMSLNNRNDPQLVIFTRVLTELMINNFKTQNIINIIYYSYEELKKKKIIYRNHEFTSHEINRVIVHANHYSGVASIQKSNTNVLQLFLSLATINNYEIDWDSIFNGKDGIVSTFHSEEYNKKASSGLLEIIEIFGGNNYENFRKCTYLPKCI